MPEGSRYKFEGMQVDQPSAGVGTVDLGNLYSSFRGIDRKAWQLPDEQIQLDLLKGASPKSGADRYLQLAQVAGAAGDTLQSVIFQQKAASLLSAGSRGGGGGGGGRRGGGSGGVSTASKGDVKAAINDLTTNQLGELKTGIAQISEGIRNGAIPAASGMEAIQNGIAQYTQNANDLYSQYKDLADVTGYKTIIKSLAKEAGIGQDSSASTEINKALKENLYQRSVPNSDYISQLQEDDKNLNGPDKANYVIAFQPSSSDTLFGGSKKNLGFGITTQDVASSQGLSPVKRMVGDASDTTVFSKPDDTGNVFVPTFSLDGKTITRTIGPDDPSIKSDAAIFGTSDYSKAGLSVPFASLDVSQTQNAGDQGKSVLDKFRDVTKQYALAPLLGAAAPLVPLVGSLLNRNKDQGISNPIASIFSTPNAQAAELPSPFAGVKSGVQGAVQNRFSDMFANPQQQQLPNNAFQSILDTIKQKSQQSAARKAPVVQLPETPVSRSSTGLVSKAGGGYSNPFADVKGGVQGQVTPAAQNRMDPLQLRNQASMAALNGFKSFANFLKGIF